METNRYQVVKKGFWWKVKIGDGERTVGRCYTEIEAQRLAAELLTAFHDGLFLAQKEIKAAVEAEREACASLCDSANSSVYGLGSFACAKAIRAMGNV